MVFVEGPLMQRDVTELLAVFSRSLPEALPRRYGLWEPPQHQLAVEGINHFKRFMATNESIVWYTQAPVASVHVFVPTERDLRRGFRSGTLSVSIDVDAVRQSGWHRMVQTLWKDLSTLAHPFYGEVFLSRGWERKRGRYWYRLSHSAADDSIPERGNLWGWWRGIPHRQSALGVVLGPPYLDLWRGFAEQSQRIGDLGFVSTEDWTEMSDALIRVGPPPADISEQIRRPDGDADYPPVWPFAR